MGKNRDAAAGAKKAIKTTKTLIKKKCYRDARDCIKTAMEVYPSEGLLEEEGFGLLIVSETLYYGNIYLTSYGDFDCYSVLHLSPSSSEVEVRKRCDELKKEVIHLYKNMRYPFAMDAHYFLLLSCSLLCNKSIRSHLDTTRKSCVFLDWPLRQSTTTTTTCSSSFKESYLDWKPPVYRDDFLKFIMRIRENPSTNTPVISS